MVRTETLIVIGQENHRLSRFSSNDLKKKGYDVIRISGKEGLVNLLNTLDQEEAMARCNPLVAVSDSSNSLPESCARALGEKGWRILKIADKAKLVELLCALLPDLIVTDIRSTDMDGLELLEEVKICGRTRDIPVIVTSDLVGLKGEAMNLGAKEFLVKPFGTDEFMKAAETAVVRSPWYDG